MNSNMDLDLDFLCLYLVAGWLITGLGFGIWSFAGDRPKGWPLGFAVVVVFWPFALIPWDRMGLD